MGKTEKITFSENVVDTFIKRKDKIILQLKKGNWTVLYPTLSTQLIFFFDNKFGRVFVPKFFHDKRAENFLLYVGDGPDNGRCEYREVGRKYYEYKKSTSGSSVKSVLATDLD